MKLWLATMLSVLSLTMGANAAAADASPPNLALRRPYTFSVQPTYNLCTDPGDATQLTDGATSTNFASGLWWQKSTVGWHNNGMVSITVDLGQTYPVGGIDFTSAAGGGDVGAPAMIHLWISEDGKSFRFGGELIAAAWRKGLPIAPNAADSYRGRPVGSQGNAGFTYSAEDLKLSGRYIKLTVLPGGQYLYMPLSTQSGVLGVFGILLTRKTVKPETKRLIEAWARLAAISLERIKLYNK